MPTVEIEVPLVRRFALLLLLPLAFGAIALVAPASGAASTAALPTVKGNFNQTPTISFPSSKPPTTLVSKYLHKGNGPKVKKGELLVANYVGQIWHGKVFDSSFARNQLSGFPIGVGEVIPAWDDTLVGAPIGSRLLLVVPPADGYGSSGNTGAGITGTDTIVFVVDVVNAYTMSAVGDPHATVEQSDVSGVTVTGKANVEPKVTVKKGSKQPTKVTTTLLDKGHGKKVTAGLVVLQLLQVDWTGKTVASTWALDTPYGANIGVTSSPSIFDGLVGMPLGSRVLIELPKITSDGSTEGPYALVTDVVAEPHDGAT